MDQPLILPVLYKGIENAYPVSLVPMGYTFKLIVVVDGVAVTFERDEEMNFRALTAPDLTPESSKIDPLLLGAISNALSDLLT